MIDLIEFSVRHAFDRRSRHFVNPEHVGFLSSVDRDQETIIHMKDGSAVTVEGSIDRVCARLQAYG